MKKHWLFTWRGLTKSVSVRFVLLVFLLQIFAVVGTGVYAERVMWKRFERHEIVPVRRFRDSVLAHYKVAGVDGLTAFLNERTSASYTNDVALLLVHPDGKILAGNLRDWPSFLEGDANWSTGSLRVRGTIRDQHMGMLITDLDGGYRLLTGTAVISEDALFAVYIRNMLISSVVALITTFFIACAASALLAREFGGIARIATHGAVGQFAKRLTTNGSGDHFDRLKMIINQSLDKAESMVGELRLVSSGLAHDLRAPITRLRVTLERALQVTDDAKSVEGLHKMMAETDALLTILAMTLQIANATAETSRERFKATDVRALLQDMAEIYGPLAEERGFTIIVGAQEGMSKLLHRELLGHALSNLIENALNYADGGNQILLSAGREIDTVNISVSDNGTGIPAHRQEDAKRRYGRLDNARQLSGAGLGLSLVEAVARLHGGDMTFSDNAPGLIVTMTFPAKKF